jgi:[protein-PII] uridylyltransferase
MKDLVRAGVLTSPEYEELRDAREFLMRVRNVLHMLARRRSDRLGFEQQEQLTELLGYGKGGAAVEQFMSDYYREARVLDRFRDSLMQRAVPPPTRRPRERSIGGGLKLTNDAVSIEHPTR